MEEEEVVEGGAVEPWSVEHEGEERVEGFWVALEADNQINCLLNSFTKSMGVFISH